MGLYMFIFFSGGRDGLEVLVFEFDFSERREREEGEDLKPGGKV